MLAYPANQRTVALKHEASNAASLDVGVHSNRLAQIMQLANAAITRVGAVNGDLMQVRSLVFGDAALPPENVSPSSLNPEGHLSLLENMLHNLHLQINELEKHALTFRTELT
jgi:hypothetical protein